MNNIDDPSPAITTEIVRDALAGIVGEAHCLHAPEDQTTYLTDYRKIYRGRAALVVRPETTRQVSEILRWCTQHRVPVVPHGGNTSLMGGSVPDESGTSVVLSMARFNKVVHVDPVNDTMLVEAGVTLTQARNAAEALERLFPLRIGFEGSCQIGGNLSTNAGGTAVLRYGNMRDLVLGIEAVMPDGRVYSVLRGLRKDNTGYDLKHLFVGSEGTLGVITAATLKLFPLPTSSATALVAVQDPSAAVQLLGLAKRLCGPSLTTFELISPAATDLVLGQVSEIQWPLAERCHWTVLIELTSSGAQDSVEGDLTALLEAGLESKHATDAAVANTLSQAQNMWRLREEISDAQTRARGSVRCDVSVPISAIDRFIGEAGEAVRSIAPRARMVVYGHLGDGNVHFNPLRPADEDAEVFVAQHGAAIATAVDDLVHRLNGSISAEHGIGIAKRDELLRYKTRVELELMWAIKRALDPTLILNPGKVLPTLADEADA